MDASGVTMLSGTDGASYPFWSPDGLSLAFFADDKLKRVAIAGTPPQILCPAARGRGGSWHANGTLLFASTVDDAERLQWLPDSGGMPTVVPVLDGPTWNRRWPHFLPDTATSSLEYLGFRAVPRVGEQAHGCGDRAVWQGVADWRHPAAVPVSVGRYVRRGAKDRPIPRERSLESARTGDGPVELESAPKEVAPGARKLDRTERA